MLFFSNRLMTSFIAKKTLGLPSSFWIFTVLSQRSSCSIHISPAVMFPLCLVTRKHSRRKRESYRKRPPLSPFLSTELIQTAWEHQAVSLTFSQRTAYQLQFSSLFYSHFVPAWNIPFNLCLPPFPPHFHIPFQGALSQSHLSSHLSHFPHPNQRKEFTSCYGQQGSDVLGEQKGRGQIVASMPRSNTPLRVQTQTLYVTGVLNSLAD